MAGDYDAGRAFAKVYTPAASTTTLDQIGFNAYIFGGTGKALIPRTSRGSVKICRRWPATQPDTSSTARTAAADTAVIPRRSAL